MSDLFSGQNSIQPWLQRTIHEHLLDTLENQAQSCCAVEEQQVARRSEKSKPVQIVDLAIAGDRDVDSSSSSSSSYLLISDGANSIVGELLPQQGPQHGCLPSQRRPSALTRGCMVRMEDWEIHVEPRCPPHRTTTTTTTTQNNEVLFQQHAVSNHGNTAVYLKVFGNVVKMGDRDITGRPEPVIKDTDVQRVLIAMMADGKTTAAAAQSRHQDTMLLEGVDRDDLPLGPINGVFAEEGRFSSRPDAPATLCGDAADSRQAISVSSEIGADIPPPAEEFASQEPAPGLMENQRTGDLPIGNFSDILVARDHADWVSRCVHALTTKAKALPFASSEDDNHHQQQQSEKMERLSNKVRAAPQTATVEERPSRDLEKELQSPLESSLTETVAKAQLEAAGHAHSQSSNKASSVQSSSEESDSEEGEEDEEANQGIGNMLIDPTQKESQESAEAVPHDEHTSHYRLRRSDHVDDGGADKRSKPQPSVLPQATTNMERAVPTQKADKESSDGEEVKGEDGDKDDDFETQPLDILVNSQQTAGEASNEKTSQPQGRETGSELTSNVIKPYPKRKKAAKRKEPEPNAAVSSSFVSNADRLFSIIDSANDSEKPPPAAKRTKGFRFGGDSLRAFLDT